MASTASITGRGKSITFGWKISILAFINLALFAALAANEVRMIIEPRSYPHSALSVRDCLLAVGTLYLSLLLFLRAFKPRASPDRRSKGGN